MISSSRSSRNSRVVRASVASAPREEGTYAGGVGGSSTSSFTSCSDLTPRVSSGGSGWASNFTTGSSFTADGDKLHDVKARAAMAAQRWGTLRHVFNSPHLSLTLKLRLYSAAVCSVLMYGCESWFLTTDVLRAINGANSRLLSRFTGKTVQQEARPNTTSLNLIRRIRKLRLRWLGQILRSGNHRLIFKAVEAQHKFGMTGGLLMNAPPFVNVQDLIPLANDQEAWCAIVRKI